MRVLLYELAPDRVTRGQPFEVDNILSSGVTSDSALTDNPVEDGTDITDNQTDKPDSQEVEAVVSDRPIDGSYQPGRARAAWDKLNELKRGRPMLELALPLFGSQTSVRLQRFSATINNSTGVEVLRFTASFREVEVKTSQRVPVEKRKVTKAKGPVELGDQSTLPADTALSETARTVAKQFLDALKGKKT